MIGMFVLITITSCKENSKDPQKAEAILPTISKENLQNQAWQMEEQYWDYVGKIDTVAYKELWHNDFIGVSLRRSASFPE